MIVRIVNMSFQPEKVPEFLKIFQESKEKIRAFNGCIHLKLLQNKQFPNQLSTYSHWENKKDLEVYRNSELFNHTWAKTKILFNEKPVATSFEIVAEL